eukprot:765065-Hanusia_phi.AAC.3
MRPTLTWVLRAAVVPCKVCVAPGVCSRGSQERRWLRALLAHLIFRCPAAEGRRQPAPQGRTTRIGVVTGGRTRTNDCARDGDGDCGGEEEGEVEDEDKDKERYDGFSASSPGLLHGAGIGVEKR